MKLQSRWMMYGAIAIAIGIPGGMAATAIFHNKALIEKNQTLARQLKQERDAVKLQPIIANSTTEIAQPDFCPATITTFFDVARVLQKREGTCEQELTDAKQKLKDAEQKLDDAGDMLKRLKKASWITWLQLRKERETNVECEPATTEK